MLAEVMLSFYARRSKMQFIPVLTVANVLHRHLILRASEKAKLHPSPSFSYLAFFPKLMLPVPWSLFFLQSKSCNSTLPTSLAPANLILLLKISSLWESTVVALTPGCILLRWWVPELLCSGEKKWGTAAIGKGRCRLIAAARSCNT